jgi:hypothetical protein
MAAAAPTQSQFPSGTQLSYAQVAAYARNAGFPENQIAMAVAIADLESGRHPNIEGRVDPRDKGLMQINSHYHPEVLRINWRNPQENMNLAHTIWAARNNWSEWHTAGAAVLLSKSPTITQAVGSSHSLGDIAGATASGVGKLTGLDAAGNALSLAAKAGTWINNPRNWTRIMYVILGGALLVGALVVVAQPVAGPAIKTAVKLAK